MTQEDFIALLIAAGLGAVIGLERALHAKPAGLRTNVLIGLGACLFTIISRMVFENVGVGDSTRIAAQIVSGIGFLGAGAIIQDRCGVHGLTTAASIWLVASLGMACGFGYYWLASATAGIGILSLFLLGPISKWLHKKALARIKNQRDELSQ